MLPPLEWLSMHAFDEKLHSLTAHTASLQMVPEMAPPFPFLLVAPMNDEFVAVSDDDVSPRNIIE